MIDRQNGDLVFECDHCGQVFESGLSDFNTAWDQAKSQGWRARKIGMGWEHECPDCS